MVRRKKTRRELKRIKISTRCCIIIELGRNRVRMYWSIRTRRILNGCSQRVLLKSTCRISHLISLFPRVLTKGSSLLRSGRYLVMTSSRDTARSNLLWIADLQDPQNKEIGPDMKWNKLINEWGTYWSELTNDGSKFYFYTNANDSPNYKIVTYDLEKPDQVRATFTFDCSIESMRTERFG